MIAPMTAARSRWLQQAREIWRDPAFRLGVADSRPVAFGVAAWGLVAGAAMVKSGLAMPLAALMSLMMFAGAAQLSALPLISGGAPMWVIWATALCINLRFMVFSVQYRPYFAHLPRRRRILLSYFSGDTMFALFTRRYPDPVAAPEQVRYFAGGAAVNVLARQNGATVRVVDVANDPFNYVISEYFPDPPNYGGLNTEKPPKRPLLMTAPSSSSR